MLRRLFLVLTACFLAACSGDSSVTPDHKALESPTGEAVLRHMLSLCPHRTDAHNSLIPEQKANDRRHNAKVQQG
mgnify:CR=1 FL=1